MKEFACVEWQRARGALESAHALVETDPESAVSRAYYAAFHALSAVFGLQDVEFSKHAALRSALHRDLVKPGHWPASLGRDYDYLLDLRETADYGGVVRASVEEAREALACARRVVDQAAASCPELGQSGPPPGSSPS